jgi:hypothetical protein
MGRDERLVKQTDSDVSEEDEDVGPDADPTNIHIYEEPETGGNLCAKLMFFTLFSSLIVLIALVAINYQGDFQSMYTAQSAEIGSLGLIILPLILQRILRKQNPDILNTLTTWTKSHLNSMMTDTMTVSIQIQINVYE